MGSGRGTRECAALGKTDRKNKRRHTTGKAAQSGQKDIDPDKKVIVIYSSRKLDG